MLLGCRFYGLACPFKPLLPSAPADGRIYLQSSCATPDLLGWLQAYPIEVLKPNNREGLQLVAGNAAFCCVCTSVEGGMHTGNTPASAVSLRTWQGRLGGSFHTVLTVFDIVKPSS